MANSTILMPLVRVDRPTDAGVGDNRLKDRRPLGYRNGPLAALSTQALVNLMYAVRAMLRLRQG